MDWYKNSWVNQTKAFVVYSTKKCSTWLDSCRPLCYSYASLCWLPSTDCGMIFKSVHQLYSMSPLKHYKLIKYLAKMWFKHVKVASSSLLFIHIIEMKIHELYKSDTLHCTVWIYVYLDKIQVYKSSCVKRSFDSFRCLIYLIVCNNNV